MKLIILTLLVIILSIHGTIATDPKRGGGIRSGSTSGEIVVTADGPIRGHVKPNHRVFYGIPYASPPINHLRFNDPVDMPVWTEIRDCLTPSKGCIQDCNLGHGACPEDYSEDCLYLDVFTPSIQYLRYKKSPLPVVVMVPGGAFQVGAGSVPVYDASVMANSSKTIVVVINYRLGALGFLATPSTSGNFGFVDQVKALHWVHDNIHAFGGDPAKVTLMGQSAGALSVAAHLASPLSANLFHRAIIMSCPTSLGFKPRQLALNKGLQFANKVGCPDQSLECLRGVSSDEILAAQLSVSKTNLSDILNSFTPFAPVLDGQTFLQQPIDLFNGSSSTYNEVPIIIGDVQDETQLFIYLGMNFTLINSGYILATAQLFPGNAAKVREIYPGPIWSDNRPVLTKLTNDYLFACPTRRIVKDLSLNSDYPVYLYRYKHLKEATRLYPCEEKICHGEDLPYLFNSYDDIDMYASPREIEMAMQMNNYFTNFVNNGDPNVGLHVDTHWDTYNPSDGDVVASSSEEITYNKALIIDVDFTMADIDHENPGCDLFDTLPNAYSPGYNTRSNRKKQH